MDKATGYIQFYLGRCGTSTTHKKVKGVASAPVSIFRSCKSLSSVASLPYVFFISGGRREREGKYVWTL